MALVSITGENQWFGAFNPGARRGADPLVCVTINGAPTGATVITLRRRPVGDTTWRIWMTFIASDAPISFAERMLSGWECDIGVATGQWGAGTLSVEIA